MEIPTCDVRRTIVVKIGKIAVCLLFLAPLSGHGQDYNSPELPVKTDSSGFINDILPPATETGPDSLIPSGTSMFMPYQSQIQNPDETGTLGNTTAPPESAFNPPPDLLTGSLYQGGITSLNTPQLLPSAIRQSLARTWEGREAGSNTESYNLKIGDAKFQLGFGFGVEANDNIFTSETNRQFDLILQPQMQVSSALRLSDLNTIQLSLGLGYQAYVSHPAQDSLTLSPGSQLAFIVYAGDFRFQVHDQFSLEENPVLQPSVSNVANTGLFTNDIGGLVTWDLNKVILDLGYDHINVISTQSDANYPSQAEEAVTLTGIFLVNSGLRTGLESTISFTSFEKTANLDLGDSTQLKVGPFVEWRLTAASSLQADAGYDGFYYNQTQHTASSSNVMPWFGNLTFSQTLNPHVSQTLSFGQETSSGLNSTFQQMDYVRHTVNWNIVDKVGIGTALYIGKTTFGGEGTVTQKNTQYGAGLTLGWQLNSRINLSSQYQFIYETSNSQGAGYTQNTVLLNFIYHF